MPTPFQHLCYAQTMLEAQDLPAALQARLQQAAGAFFLGNTAADVQSITGQSRPTTHFFAIPPTGNPRGEIAMLRTYPWLADPRQLTLDHAAFISGYLAHLVWDQRWAWDIYCRYYWDTAPGNDWLSRVVEHNALRVLLDRQAEQTLQTTPWILSTLRTITPGPWLPFADESALQDWKTWIMNQLAHPGTAQTAEVFAARNGVDVERLELATRRLQVEAESGAAPASLSAVARYEEQALRESVAVLRRFWRCEAAPWENNMPWLAELTTIAPTPGVSTIAP